MLALANTANKSFRGKFNFEYVNMEACIMCYQLVSCEEEWEVCVGRCINVC